MVKKKIKRPSSTGRPAAGPGLAMGGGGMMNQIRQLQEEMARTQESLGDEVVTVSVGGGAVQMTMTGQNHLQSVQITPDILNPDDVEMLQDLIVAAVNEALEQAQKLASDRMDVFTGGLNIPGLF